LVQEQFGFVWRSLRRLGLSAADADDAAQQVFLVLDRKLSEVAPGRERAFLFGTAAKVAARARRTVARRRECDEAPSAEQMLDRAPHPEEALEQRRAADQLNEVLESMPEDIRSVFILYEVEQLTMAEISELVGAKAGTVASRLRRGRDLFEKGVTRLKVRETGSRGAS
jgi:RNA polymerase sigma-70 factor (ECF subfamily)